jgi:nucleotide-binding universal stress UspA family protein
MTTNAGLPVVAGVDGTADGIAAAEYAAQLAEKRSLPLVLLHAYRRSPAINPLLPVGEPVPAGSTTKVAYQPYVATYNVALMRDAGATALVAAHNHLEPRFPRLRIREQLVAGSVAKALVKASRTACTVVVARNHERSVERFFAGSTSSAVAAHAKCPVIVVPTNWEDLPRTGRIVVGLDAAKDEAAVVEFAFQHAAITRSELVAIHAWQPPATWLDRRGVSITGHGNQGDDEERLLSEALAGWAERYPDVHVSTRVVSASPAKALILASDTADLVVMGARGQGDLRALSLGSTVRAVVSHASCATVVVRHAGQREPAATRTDLPETYPMTAFY